MIIRPDTYPFIHLLLSLECNLKCIYCSQQYAKKTINSSKKEGLSDEELVSFYKNLEPSQFYLSGGEPLIFPGIKTLISDLMRHGHMVSLDTNLCIDHDVLESYLNNWNPQQLPFINITHHVSQVSYQALERKVLTIQRLGHRCFVKYIALPDCLEEITTYMNQWRQLGIGVRLTSLFGIYRGKRYPDAYTNIQLQNILEKITMAGDGLQLFDGIDPEGVPCRGGNDVIAIRKYHPEPFISCCHGEANPLQLGDTYFGSRKRRRQPCVHQQCLLFCHGFNSISAHNELEQICKGDSPPISKEEFYNYTKSIVDKGFTIYQQERLNQTLLRWDLAPLNEKKYLGAVQKYTVTNLIKHHGSLKIGLLSRKVSFSSIPQQWAYICQFLPCDILSQDQFVRFQIKLELSKGLLGIGLLHPSGNTFLKETTVFPSTKKQSFTLEVLAKGQIPGLVFRNCAEKGEYSQGKIHQVEVQTEL